MIRPPRAHWLSWSRGEEQGQTRHGVPRSSRRCKSHEGTALGKRGGKRSRAYAGDTSTVSRGTSKHAPTRSDEAPVNELTFTESERVASGCLPHAIEGNRRVLNRALHGGLIRRRIAYPTKKISFAHPPSPGSFHDRIFVCFSIPFPPINSDFVFTSSSGGMGFLNVYGVMFEEVGTRCR